MNQPTTTDVHAFFLQEFVFHHMNLLLAMVNFMQFDYLPDYLAAVEKLFPSLFKDVNDLSEWLKDQEINTVIELSDDQICTLYISFDLMGRMMVSEYYEGFKEEMSGSISEKSMKQISRVSVSKIRPFLQAVELYSLQNGLMPKLAGVKGRLALLPVLP